MTTPAAFQELPLFSRGGLSVGSVSVPCSPHPPVLIQWGQKFFVRPQGELRYFLVECYLVPVENMYPRADKTATGSGV